MQQMMENPQLMQNMLSAPYTQSMLQAFAADPNMAAQIVNSNPLFADNPALQVSRGKCNNMSYRMGFPWQEIRSVCHVACGSCNACGNFYVFVKITLQPSR